MEFCSVCRLVHKNYFDAVAVCEFFDSSDSKLRIQKSEEFWIGLETWNNKFLTQVFGHRSYAAKAGSLAQLAKKRACGYLSSCQSTLIIRKDLIFVLQMDLV